MGLLSLAACEELTWLSAPRVGTVIRPASHHGVVSSVVKRDPPGNGTDVTRPRGRVRHL